MEVPVFPRSTKVLLYPMSSHKCLHYSKHWQLARLIMGTWKPW